MVGHTPARKGTAARLTALSFASAEGAGLSAGRSANASIISRYCCSGVDAFNFGLFSSGPEFKIAPFV